MTSQELPSDPVNDEASILADIDVQNARSLEEQARAQRLSAQLQRSIAGLAARQAIVAFDVERPGYADSADVSRVSGQVPELEETIRTELQAVIDARTEQALAEIRVDYLQTQLFTD